MQRVPGIELKFQGRASEPSPVHSDVAGFIGRTRRGPIGDTDANGSVIKRRAYRVEGWRRFVRDFGGLDRDCPLTYSVRGYFENGGKYAYISRLGCCSRRIYSAGSERNTETPFFGHHLHASSPGQWGKEITVQYRSYERAKRTFVDAVVSAPHEPTEYLQGLEPDIKQDQEFAGEALTMSTRIANESYLIRAKRIDPIDRKTKAPTPPTGVLQFYSFRKSYPSKARRDEFLAAIQAIEDEPEVAMVSVPDLPQLFEKKRSQQFDILQALMTQATAAQDRLILVDCPAKDSSEHGADSLIEFVRNLRRGTDNAQQRNVAVYHPWIWTTDPLSEASSPLRQVPPSGHVAGAIARTDLVLGAHHSPANVRLYDAADTTAVFDDQSSAELFQGGVNLIACRPGQGLRIISGRTIDLLPQGRYVAHRRLMHRMIRSIRRITEPIIFEGNNELLRLSLARAVTTVLLELFHTGALKGDRPEDAFRVRCNDENNGPEQQDLGRVICELSFAPAVPMEFITLRIALSESRELEVQEQ